VRSKVLIASSKIGSDSYVDCVVATAWLHIKNTHSCSGSFLNPRTMNLSDNIDEGLQEKSGSEAESQSHADKISSSNLGVITIKQSLSPARRYYLSGSPLSIKWPPRFVRIFRVFGRVLDGSVRLLRILLP